MMAAIDDPTTLGRARLSFADQHDIDEFLATLEKFERGEIGSDQWRAFRLVRGTYGQRQDGDVHMLRVKSCFERRYLDRATQLVELILEKFWENGLFFTPRDGERLVHRPRAPYDNAWPSGTSTSVFALLRLHELTGHDRYREAAEHVFRMYGAAAAKNPFGFAHLLAAQDFAQRGPLEIVLAGDKLGATALVESVHRAYLPARVLAFAEDVPIGEGRHPVDGQPAAYVCRNRTCDAPVTSVKALLERCAA